MGCCYSFREEGPKKLKEEIGDNLTDIRREEQVNMPKRRQDNSDKKYKGSQAHPPKSRKREEKNEVSVFEWNRLCETADKLKQQNTKLEQRRKDDQQSLEDTRKRISQLQNDNSKLKEQLKGGNRSKDDQQALEDSRKRISQLQNENSKLKEQLKGSQEELNAKEDELTSKIRELTNLSRENDQLRSRVSAITGARLTDNNPNIVNLSDANRPTKLGERYAELYDNEWTDIVEKLQTLDIQERQAIDMLRDMLTDIYTMCKDQARRQKDLLDQSIVQFSKEAQLPTELVKHLKEARKENYKAFLPELTKDIEKRLENRGQAVVKVTKVYQVRCTELCWLMCIQDPPVHMDCDVTIHGQPFNRGSYREYTATGPVVDYVVWPTLYLCKGGGVLCKGAAQAMKQQPLLASQRQGRSAGTEKTVIKL